MSKVCCFIIADRSDNGSENKNGSGKEMENGIKLEEWNWEWKEKSEVGKSVKVEIWIRIEMEKKVGAGLAYKFYFRDLVSMLNTVLISDCLMAFGWTTVTARRFMLQRSVEVLGRNNTKSKLMQLLRVAWRCRSFCNPLADLVGQQSCWKQKSLGATTLQL